MSSQKGVNSVKPKGTKHYQAKGDQTVSNQMEINSVKAKGTIQYHAKRFVIELSVQYNHNTREHVYGYGVPL